MDERRRLQDLGDYNNEAAGREVGRIQRFFTGENDRSEDGHRREKEKREERTRLAILMADQAYKALYNDVLNDLNALDDKLYAAMVDASDAAANGDDAAKKRLKWLQDREEELRRIRQHMNDPDNPPDADTLKRYKKRMGEIEAEIVDCQPDSQKAHSEPDAESVEPESSSGITMPVIR